MWAAPRPLTTTSKYSSWTHLSQLSLQLHLDKMHVFWTALHLLNYFLRILALCLHLKTGNLVLKTLNQKTSEEDLYELWRSESPWVTQASELAQTKFCSCQCIIKVVKDKNIGWLGKLFRSQDMNPCKRLILTEPEGTWERETDRQRLSVRWSDSTEQDIPGWVTKCIERTVSQQYDITGICKIASFFHSIILSMNPAHMATSTSKHDQQCIQHNKV